MKIYFDNSATTPSSRAVVKAVQNSLTHKFGNPSSVHQKGVEAERILKKARSQAAEVLNVKSKEIFFLSGGTEANNLALRGVVKNKDQEGPLHIISSSIEHDSVYQTLKEISSSPQINVTFIKPNEQGIITSQKVEKALRANTILVSIMLVNNETGAVQPIKKIGQMLSNSAPQTLFHVDAVQGLGYLPLKLKAWQVDMASFSGHKIGAPKGTGFLWLRDSRLLEPLISGGKQEKGLRSGTENVSGIAGLAAALKEIPRFSSSYQSKHLPLTDLKEYFIQQLESKLPEARVNTPQNSAPHIINFSLKEIPGEVMVNALSSRGIFISRGSACHARQGDDSRVLREMGVTGPWLKGALRISFSRQNTKEEVDGFFAALLDEYQLLL